MLPVIDVSPLLDPQSSLTERERAAREIGDACREIGFFDVTNHGVPDSHRELLFDRAKAFFDLPNEEKMKVFIGKSEHFRGYIPLGGEVTKGLKDWHESLDLRSEFAENHPAVLAGKPLHGPNQWPEEPPELRGVLEDHFTYMQNLGQALTRGLALSLGLEEAFLKPFVDEAFCNMRILHYPLPESDDPSVGLGIGPHIDYGFLTILDQDQAGGLEVVDASGDWVPVGPVPDAYLVNIGRVTQIWTNDLYKATEHRVRTVPRDRYSVPFFFNPNFDSLIEPLEVCVSADNPPRYEPYRHGEFLAERFQKSFGANRTKSD